MRIVLTADDFGLDADTVRATIACFEAGQLTSASLMPGMPAFDEAVAFATAHPEFSYGVHLTFVGGGDERSSAPPAEIPALVDEHGRFPATAPGRVKALLHRLPQDQIEREVEHYEKRVEAERESQRQPDDLTADAARLGAPDIVQF